ncbi:MAG: ribosome-associated translation inhibitor RaiA [Hornefia sp.]|nr:ribosome-associated translation inhibitor RaiA [Hornefia sp.]
MKVNIISKNFKTYQKLEDKIESKFEKLSKYFSDEIVANVVLSHQRGNDKLEATINAKGAVFRAESVAEDVYESLDNVIAKLSHQMSKFKGKLQKRYNDNKSLKFEFLPDFEEESSEPSLVKTKQLELRPMNVEEAILEMEMLQHDFFLFLNMESGSVCLVYRRKDDDYGLLETKY